MEKWLHKLGRGRDFLNKGHYPEGMLGKYYCIKIKVSVPQTP